MIKSALLGSSAERTLESLYKRHATDVYRYSLAILHRQADAEDATQTTFMNAYRALQHGERPRDAARWLRTIALNVCREQYRRVGRRPDEVSLDEDPGELVLDPPTPAIGDIVRGLHCLPFNQRAALVMREFEGRSLAEIATALESSTSAVETLLFRARRALREQLEEQLSCSQAEEAISRQLDGALPRAERGRLRAHLRACPDCASLARKLRGQRSAIRSLAILPVPASIKLGKLMGGGATSATGAAAGTSAIPAGGSVFAGLLGSAAAKIALVTVAGGAALGVGYESLHAGRSHQGAPARAADRTAAGHVLTARPVLAARRSRTAANGAASAGRAKAAHALGVKRGAATRSRPGGAKRSAVASGGAFGGHTHNGHSTSTAAGAAPARQGATATPSTPAHVSHGHSAVHGAGSPAAGHAYGRTRPKKVKAAPPAHAYGQTKPKPAKPAPATQRPQRPAIPPGQAKKQGATPVVHGRGALK